MVSGELWVIPLDPKRDVLFVMMGGGFDSRLYPDDVSCPNAR